MTPRAASTVVLIALAGGCAKTAATPEAQAEALVIVDTDAAVPVLVARLRVDLYATDGTWFATRDSSLANVLNWPTSFAVTLADTDKTKDVVVRLRAYPEGATRDSIGEHFQQRATSCDRPSCLGKNPDACCPFEPAPVEPPLAAQALPGSSGIAPRAEPAPLQTIDRLLLVHLEAGVRGSTRVLLAGACFGTMSDLRDFTQLTTCVDTENTPVAVTPVTLDPDLTVPSTSVAGSFGQTYAIDCTVPPRAGGHGADGSPLHDDEVCVAGGAFVFGGRDGLDGSNADSLPARVALLPSFLMDRQEVTVAQLRAAQKSGFTGTAQLNDGPLGGYDSDAYDLSMCTYSSTPVGREEFPINCVTQTMAVSFCRMKGGTLPTEVQWEYAATASARPGKTHFSMGDDYPGCNVAVYGRGNRGYNTDCDSADGLYNGKVRVGPAPVTATDHQGGDVTPGLSIANLTGNVSEWMADTFAPYVSNCWMQNGLVAPSCTAKNVPVFTPSARGSGWVNGGITLMAEGRQRSSGTQPLVGFRCVRPGAG